MNDHDEEVEEEPVGHETCCCDRPHDEPSGSEFTCPTTNDEYVNCTNCGWVEDRWGANTFNGETFCEDCYYEATFCCDGCGNRGWSDDSWWNNHTNQQLCRGCYEEESTGAPPPAQGYCSTCHTSRVHLHGYSEEWLCDCGAARTKVSGRPVELAHVLPQAVWDEAVSWADTTGVRRLAVR